MNRTARKTTRTKVESLRPFVKITLDGEGTCMVEDNLPDGFEGRAMAANMVYGAFQALANEAEKLAPKLELPTTEQVTQYNKPQIVIARS